MNSLYISYNVNSCILIYNSVFVSKTHANRFVTFNETRDWVDKRKNIKILLKEPQFNHLRRMKTGLKRVIARRGCFNGDTYLASIEIYGTICVLDQSFLFLSLHCTKRGPGLCLPREDTQAGAQTVANA